jgi:hypothetical protein
MILNRVRLVKIQITAGEGGRVSGDDRNSPARGWIHGHKPVQQLIPGRAAGVVP